MADRKYAGLNKGAVTDYASPSRILSLFNHDMKAVRAEYSRQRSIIRKRVERMEAAGEISSSFYQNFGKNRLKPVKELSDREILMQLTRTASALAGGRKSSLQQIRDARKAAQADLLMEAKKAGDTELAKMLEKPMTDKQYRDALTIMHLVYTVASEAYDHSAWRESVKLVLNKKKGDTLLSMAASILSSMDFDEDEEGQGGMKAMEELKSRFTSRGKTRVSWSKAHGRRGR